LAEHRQTLLCHCWKKTVDVLAGVNLPMLIKIAQARSTASLSALAAEGLDAGARYIALGSAITSAQP